MLQREITMFGFGKNKAKTSDQPEENTAKTEPKAAKPKLFKRLADKLRKTRVGLGDGLVNLLRGSKQIDDQLLEDIETQLLMADIGVDVTQALLDTVTAKVSRKELKDPEALIETLKAQMSDILAPVAQPLEISGKGPFVILVVGINGAGKTTTIGKMANRFRAEGKSVMLAAGDTFRAAAVEQLQEWGDRNDVPVVAQQSGSDSASVIYDALQSAKAKNVDVLIADTAGRLHNKTHLMAELEKIIRVMKKLDPDTPHETLLVLDAGTGLNAINQTEQFHQQVSLSGLCLTKLDGTAKGGIIFALAQKFSIPIRYIGVGETAEDLRVFDHQEFVSALFDEDLIDK